MRSLAPQTQFTQGFLSYSIRSFYKESMTFNLKQYAALSENEYARYAPNPAITAYLLVQSDSIKPNFLEVKQYSFTGIVSPVSKTPVTVEESEHDSRKEIEVPSIEKISDLSASYDLATGDIVLQGKTEKGIKMIGKPHCQLGYEPAMGLSQTYTYYSMKPDTHLPIKETIKKFQESADAEKLQKQKSGRSKSSNDLIVVNKDVPLRSMIKTRTPDQKDVMRCRAVDAYLMGLKEYQKIFSPVLAQMLMHAGNITHLSTIRARLGRGECVGKQEIADAYRDRLFRPEWLHRHAFVLHAMNENPQTENNLAAARACDNTRMMLLERALKWFALHVSESKNSLNGKFDLLLDTEIIEKITLLATCIIHQSKFTLKQEIDSLVKNPDVISASDLAGLVTLLSFLIRNQQPEKVDVVKVLPSLSPSTFFDARYREAVNDKMVLPCNKLAG